MAGRGRESDALPLIHHTPGDLCVAQSAKPAPAAHGGLVLTACILASSLAFVDGSVVNVGLPAIGASLRGDSADLQWVINAYLLPLSALLLLGGAVGDRFGRRNVLALGIALFGVGSALCAVAASLSWLLAARVLQGIGAAFLLPSSLAILGGTFEGEARGRAVGTWSAASAIAGAIGPVLGGWLIDVSGWRAVFLINLPLAAAAIALALAFVRDPARREAQAPLDVAGALLATCALAALTWGLTVGTGRAGWSPLAIGAVAAGAVLGVGFLWLERRRGERAMMPLALFGSAGFAGLTALTFLLYGALGGLLVLVPYVLIEGAGYSATQAGAALLPFPLLLALTSRAMGAVAGRIGSRWPLTLGPMVVALGFLLLLRVTAPADFWREVLPAIVVIALGMAGAVAPLTTAVLASVDARHTGSASGLNSAVARLGGLVATALLGGVLAARGAALFDALHVAVIACALASALAGGAAFALVGRR
jgi:EmrB/QacA subfamily drug resistance transporter